MRNHWTVTTTTFLILAACGTVAAEKIYKDEAGLTRVRPPQVDAEFRNQPWPEKLETGFWKRANHAIDAYRTPAKTATTGEHEKWNYPGLMFNYLTGDKSLQAHCLQGLQLEDQNVGDHKGTKGIDFYWCFTIKGQTRKYFYFGDLLEPGYRKRMHEGGRLWTAEDPKPTLELYRQLRHPDREVRDYALKLLQQMRVSKADLPKLLEGSKYQPFKDYMNGIMDDWSDADFGRDYDKWYDWCKLLMDGDWQTYEEYERLTNPRPHPVYGRGTGPIGGAWAPQVRGLWVDGRNTDNLRAMRETTVYLFAEETGNEVIRKLYKDKLKTYVTGLYHTGMGEWDSENYHAHTIAPYINLYDFAKDPQVKLLAKAALDWLHMAGALKYYRGGYGGPTCRDYGGASRVFGSGVSHMMALYYGAPVPDPDPHYDDVHAITSSYRPPLAVYHLANRNFPKDVELHNTKPTYSNWRPGQGDAPQYFETLYYGDTYYLGSLAMAGGAGDVGAFKLLAYNKDRGVDYFLANTDWGRGYVGLGGNDQRGQYGNLFIWLRHDVNRPMVFQLPRSAKTQWDSGIWFIELEKTWIALKPINLADGGATGKVKGAKIDKLDTGYILKPAGEGGYSGFAMEVGEASKDHRDFASFRKNVKAKMKVDTSRLEFGSVTLVGTGGKRLSMVHNAGDNLPAVIRDGKPRKWSDEFDLYKTVGERKGGPLVSLGWKEGKLIVNAGGAYFDQTVTKDGEVSFTEERPKAGLPAIGD